MDLDLKDKVALITGAGSQIGFGKGMAMALVKEGVDIIVCDMDLENVEFIYASDLVKDPKYWELVLEISIKSTLNRIIRCTQIMGRKETDMLYASQILYPLMQAADIFFLNVDICQLGLDQRKANVVARELGGKLGFWKPVCVHHHLLQGLEKPGTWPFPKDKEKEALSSAKMSKSKPETCVFLYDSPKILTNKISKFCWPLYQESVFFSENYVFTNIDDWIKLRCTFWTKRLGYFICKYCWRII